MIKQLKMSSFTFSTDSADGEDQDHLLEDLNQDGQAKDGETKKEEKLAVSNLIKGILFDDEE